MIIKQYFTIFLFKYYKNPFYKSLCDFSINYLIRNFYTYFIIYLRKSWKQKFHSRPINPINHKSVQFLVYLASFDWEFHASSFLRLSSIFRSLQCSFLLMNHESKDYFPRFLFLVLFIFFVFSFSTSFFPHVWACSRT